MIIDTIIALEKILVNNIIDLTLLSIDDAFLLSIESSFSVNVVKIIQHENELVRSKRTMFLIIYVEVETRCRKHDRI